MARPSEIQSADLDKTPVHASELLKGQHREVEKLFSELEDSGERAHRTKMNIFEQIAHKLTCHAKIEEKILYPAAKKADKDGALEAYEEHDLVKGLIRKISHLESGDETFMAKVTVLKEMVEHHVNEEENELLPKVENLLGEEKMMELGTEMKVLFDRLDAQPIPRSGSMKTGKPALKKRSARGTLRKVK